jgi:hypothetical protein
VTLILSGLRTRRLIENRRGHLVILDDRGLSAAACECHGVLATPVCDPRLRSGASE